MGNLSMRRMNENQTGTITSITAIGELARRMRDMGLVPGTRVSIAGRAPLKDPVALRVMGCTLTLRNNEADFINVEVE
jgi:ferrous iron transport protein A